MVKISIVTPSFNQAEYLERTILSVINQQYPNLEYIIIDGGSTDGSLEIIKKYEKHLAYWESNKDEGQYHAIQKGFSKSTGEIMAWLNSDDVYHHKSLFTVAEIFKKFEQVKWLTSNISFIDQSDRLVRAYSTRSWSRLNLFGKDVVWIQQESTFWKRELWEKAGSSLNMKYSLAADFELWVRFFRTEQLYTIESLLGAFRVREKDQKTVELLDEYLIEMKSILGNEKLSKDDEKKLKYIGLYENYLIKIPFIRRLFPFKERYERFLNYPSKIEFDRNKYGFILKDQLKR
jgi:glycosyltransferase involved in cell wall biosynthesis